MRVDGAGASHEVTRYCRDAAMRFSVGFDLDERVRDAIAAVPESAWAKGIRVDGSQRKHSQVAEITDRVDLSAWPEGCRLIARRTELRDGDQQSFADHDGYRLSVFLTDSKGSVCDLDLDHRGHARVEGHIRQGKDCGLANLPFKNFAHNQVWLWLVMLTQTSSPGHGRCASTTTPARGSSNDCATGCCTSPGASPATPAKRRCASRATGPGPDRLAAAFARLQSLPAPTVA